ncbi:MAG: DHHA1 domain-containing protein [Thermoprotei archaeon]
MVWAIFAHGDSDGVSSAALVSAFLEWRGQESRVVFTHPVGLLNDLREFADSCEGLFVVDVALDELHMSELLRVLSVFSENRVVIYVDHHPVPEGFEVPKSLVWIHDLCCSASELTFRYLSGLGLDLEYSRVALYGALGDYLDETSWVKHEMSRWDRRAVYLEAGILTQGLEGSRRDYEFKRRVVSHLASNKLPSTMNELVEKSLIQAVKDENLRIWVKNNVVRHGGVSYVVNPPGSIGRAANYAKIYGEARVGIAAEERGDIYVMSLRGGPEVDLNKVLREISRKLGIHGGGHPVAAGARVKKEQFQEFLGELIERVK